MTHEEKTSLFIGLIVFIFMCLFLIGINFVIKDIQQGFADRGGFKGIAISVGKTMKEIKQEIDKEDSDGKNTD